MNKFRFEEVLMPHQNKKTHWENYWKNTTDKKHLARYELTVKYTLDLLGNVKEGKLLDVGCGSAYIDILLG